MFNVVQKEKKIQKKTWTFKDIWGNLNSTENIWGENNFRYIKKISSEILKDILENSFLCGYKVNNFRYMGENKFQKYGGK